MRLVPVLLLVTVLDLVLVCHALDDDEEEEQKYSVTFFQFKPKDLGILGGHKKNHFKRDIKRNEIEGPTKPRNETVIEKNNATSAKPFNESAVPVNTTSTNLLNQTVITPAVNETKLIQNVSESQAKDNSTPPDASGNADVNIMNALIDLAVQKNTNASTANTTTSHQLNDTSNPTVQKTSVLTNTTNVANKTKTTDATSTKRNHVSPKRDKVLNPNPKPSDQEAALNVKLPKQLENKEHDSMIHSENTTKVDVSEDIHETTTNSLEMVKNTNPPESDKATEQNSTTPTPEDEEKKKIAKDKQTNKEIKEAAKEIKPVTNTVGNPINEVRDIMKDSAPNSASPNSASARNTVHPAEHHTDEKTMKHRNSVAEFVPLYHKTSPKDHRLSFQVGSMKHPKHNIHPKCHACPLNSTYKDCVKKSTLRQCNEGLNNICFTKSTKKDGLITYEMGCSDHNNCVHAKAFPCKDDREHCFTCCQFDRCNSSPHHGDFELDELNLAELSDPATSATLKDATTLDTKSASKATTANWMAYALTLIVPILLRL